MNDAEEPPRVHEIIIEGNNAWVRGELVKHPGLVEQGVDAVCPEAFKWVSAAAGGWASLWGTGQAPELLERLVDLEISECILDDYIALGHNLVDQPLGLGIDLRSVPSQLVHGANLVVNASVVACVLMLVDHCDEWLRLEGGRKESPVHMWAASSGGQDGVPETSILYLPTYLGR